MRTWAMSGIIALAAAGVSTAKLPESESKPAGKAKAPQLGTMNRARVFAEYWRTAQYNDSVDQFNKDLRALNGKEEPEEMTLRRAKLQVEARKVRTEFETDLKKAMETVAPKNAVIAIIYGEPVYKAPGVGVVDLTEKLAAELRSEPTHAAKKEAPKLAVVAN